MTDTELKLLKSFPESYINTRGEFIAHDKANEYLILWTCKSDLDIRCKVLELFSRGAYKTEPYRQKKKNAEFNKFMLDGINAFLGTNFNLSDICRCDSCKEDVHKELFGYCEI